MKIALLNHRGCVIKVNYHLNVSEFDIFLPKDIFLVQTFPHTLLK